MAVGLLVVLAALVVWWISSYRFRHAIAYSRLPNSWAVETCRGGSIVFWWGTGEGCPQGWGHFTELPWTSGQYITDGTNLVNVLGFRAVRRGKHELGICIPFWYPAGCLAVGIIWLWRRPKVLGPERAFPVDAGPRDEPT
jgi:hypothetical protein